MTAQQQVVPTSAEPAIISETAAILSMIERVARDPSVDIARLERLMEMRERIVAQNAKRVFYAALARVQPNLPIVDRKGRIVIKEKTTERIIQSTAYALWEDINEAITPVISKEGFSLGFDAGVSPDGKITVTGILGHEEGHEKQTTITLVHDSTGSKNAVQAVGSSISYGKRYAAGLLLNITTRGEDDDGKEAGAGETISDEQAAELRQIAEEVGADIPKFCRYFKIDAIPDIAAKDYDRAIAALEAKRKRP